MCLRACLKNKARRHTSFSREVHSTSCTRAIFSRSETSSSRLIIGSVCIFANFLSLFGTVCLNSPTTLCHIDKFGSFFTTLKFLPAFITHWLSDVQYKTELENAD